MIELLVVIAIIAVLIALLLPAVQQAREAARRSQCKNNMKQLGLGLHNYHETFGRFPAQGYYAFWDGSAFQYRGNTWCTMLLPFIDQAPLYNGINFNISAWGQPHVSKQLPVLTCPSDTGMGNLPGNNRNIAVTNYAASEGYHWWSETGSTIGGVFTAHAHSTTGDIRDGTSNTIALAESCSVSYKNGPWGTCGTGELRNGVGEAVPRNAFITSTFTPDVVQGRGNQYNGQTAPYPHPDGSANMGWFQGGGPHHYCPIYMYLAGMNADWQGAGSVHEGGCHALLADGSVRFLNESLDYGVWSRLNTRMGREVVGEF